MNVPSQAAMGLLGCLLTVSTGYAAAPASTSVTDLPLVELRGSPSQSTLIVMLSGDGGWSTLTQQVAAALNERGYPVLGWNSLKYFWSPKSPALAGRDRTRAVVLLAPERTTDFTFHISAWLKHIPADQPAILPDALRLLASPCVYGHDEADVSLCTQLLSSGANIVELPGAHHFDGDYERLADLVLQAAK